MSQDTRCLGCMEETVYEDGRCPNCGYSPQLATNPIFIKPGTVINGRYLVGIVLRADGEGVTYLAYNNLHRKKCLLREFMPGDMCRRKSDGVTLSVNEDLIASYKTLKAEFVDMYSKLAAMSDNPHISKVSDISRANNTAYVAFEYISSIDMPSFLKKNGGKVTWQYLAQILPDFINMLEEIHENGLLHRAIAPHTLYLTEKSDLVLTEFSIAAAHTLGTELKSRLYDGYAAPEQYFVNHYQGTWTDVYGLCASLYKMLTGHTPLSATVRSEEDTLMPPVQLDASIPQHVSDAIMQGLKLAREERIQRIPELYHALFDQAPAENLFRPAVMAPAANEGFSQQQGGYQQQGSYQQGGSYRQQDSYRQAFSQTDRQNTGQTQSYRQSYAQNGGFAPGGMRQTGQRGSGFAQSGQFYDSYDENYRADMPDEAYEDDYAYDGYPGDPAYADYQEYNEQSYAPIRTATEDRWRAPIIIGIVLLVLLLAALFIFGRQMNLWSNRTATVTTTTTTAQTTDTSVSTSTTTTATTTVTTTAPAADSIMPNLVGLDIETARAQYSGWITFAEEEIYADGFMPGVVCWQEYDPNANFDSSVPVRIQISKGPAHVTIPDFGSQDLDSYTNELRRLNIPYDTVSEVNYAYYNNDVTNLYIYRNGELVGLASGDEIDLNDNYRFTVVYADNPVIVTDPPTQPPTDPPVIWTEPPTEAPTESESSSDYESSGGGDSSYYEGAQGYVDPFYFIFDSILSELG